MLKTEEVGVDVFKGKVSADKDNLLLMIIINQNLPN